ncbi:serine/threonine-protein kinase [Kitasatospora sp. NBC_00240]|uniref:serine/threonine-protein kinase n=1 Tax=Kitasatospora sp. NBC_00240 TaxID=2903567 RepID=UPI00224E84E0|nr:serine/threonine-protein kinase [Kitasatospora sp. NBC_00240]MCX5209141.1 serine/threonine-protein kinase [Kitasatospora sp. NBC_00240]
MNELGRPPLDVPAGRLVAGTRITGLIGSGGWGSVYAAEELADGAPVAVKFLRPDLLTPGQRRTMADLVEREVRFSRQADHPGLVRTLRTATLDRPDDPRLDGAVVLVMERAEQSLQDLLATAAPHTPLPQAQRVLTEICAGLAHMHQHGWVHGDLKGANILLMPGGAVRLADFGLTAELEGTHAYVPPLGSLDHVPPEWWSQRAGSRGVPLRPGADVWAFGVLAHQVLSGGLHPFPGATARARSLAAQSYARGASPLRLDEGVPERWRALIGACLAADPAERGKLDAAELLRRVSLLAAPPAGPQARRRPARRAVPLVTGGLALALAVAGAALAGALLPGDGDSPPAPPPVTAATATTAGATVIAGGPGRPVGAIPESSDVPAGLREVITGTARRCPEPEVTPALLAAMLKAESGFDPAAARPQSDEYGIAMWTPAVFNAWAQDGDNDGDRDYMSAPDAIVSMGNYVCWLDQQFKHRGLSTDLPALVVAGYRTSDKTVADAGRVPDRVRPHVDQVMKYLAEYTG